MMLGLGWWKRGMGTGEGGMKKGGEDREISSNDVDESSDLTYFICILRTKNSHPRQEYLNIPAILIGPAS